MGNFMTNESTFGRLMTKCGTIIVINILFAICSVPFFTIGAAAAAMYSAVFELIREEEEARRMNTAAEINPVKAFGRGLYRYGIKATALWLGFVGIMILGGMNLQICRALGGFLHILSAVVIAVIICATVILVLSLPVLTSAGDQNLSLKDTLMQAVRTVILHPLQSFPALLLTVLPLAVIFLDEANQPTYGFIGTFFGFALLAYIIGKILYPILEAPSEDSNLNGENEKSRRQNPITKLFSERKAKKYLL
jgi:hypothetical protein